MNTKIDRGTASVIEREATTAEDILTRRSREMLKHMFIMIKSNGNSGAPAQSEMDPIFMKQAAPSLK